MKKKTKTIIIIIGILVIVSSALSFLYVYNKKQKERMQLEEKKQKEAQELAIKNHYNKIVIVNKDTDLWKKEKKEYVKVGKIFKDEIVTLEDMEITYKTKYFYVKDLDLYINYKDVSKTDKEKVINERYKNYLPFNLNVISNEKVKLYRDNKIVYELNNSITGKVYRKSENGYYIEYLGELLFINNEDIKEVVNADNTQLGEASSVPVTCYHFIYLHGDNTCNEEICHSEDQIREEFQYLKENNFFTLTTKELEWFIKDQIRLPEKSILITIDDGARAENFIPLLEEFKINATLFLISSWYPKEKFASNYMEIASHSHNLHTPGVCPGGQGSPLKCQNKDELLADLRLSRETLNGTEAFCFPFYEFNDYAIEVLKEAGFKMAFIGGMRKATKGIDLYKIPRISIHSSTSIGTYKSYVN